MYSTRIIDGKYEIVKTYTGQYRHFIGLCRRLKDGELVVIKAGELKILKHETEINKLLDAEAPEITKMLDFVPAGPGTAYMRLQNGHYLSDFCYMVFPLMGPDLLDIIMQANREGIQLSWEAK